MATGMNESTLTFANFTDVATNRVSETALTVDNLTDVTTNGVSPTVFDNSSPDYGEWEGYVYDDFIYKVFPFETTIYLYVWEILVIMTLLFNVVVISVLLRKKMRNPTYMILVAISISDSLTGLVTLPTYIDVFDNDMQPLYSEGDPVYQEGAQDVDYTNISGELCDIFMISKFFLSKSFHTVSVWLTLFLCFQRSLTVWSPFQGFVRIFTTKVTVSVCVCIFVLAPFLHIYHLFNDKSHVDSSECWWMMATGSDCGEDCAYMWLALLLGHLLPAIFLIVFTIMFIYSLRKTTQSLKPSASRTSSNSSSAFVNRQRENRRASIVVTAIVIVFLIPEVPYCGFYLYNVISAHVEQITNLRVNRAIHAAYEVLLVLSFNANFYIYTFFNRRFRSLLWETVVSPVYTTTCARAWCPGKCKLGINFRISSIFSHRSVQTSSNSGSAVEMTGLKTMQTQSGGESSITKENTAQNDQSVET